MALNVSASAAISPPGPWRVTTNPPYVVLTLTNNEGFDVLVSQVTGTIQGWPSRNFNIASLLSQGKPLVVVAAGQSIVLQYAVAQEQFPAPAVNSSYQITIHNVVDFESDVIGTSATEKVVDVVLTIQRDAT
jgi:hypothetical protein